MIEEEKANSNRRAIVTSACTATAAATGSALAQQETTHAPLGAAPHAKGPAVFLDYDQAELDAAYDQAAYAPNRDQLLARYASNSELTRARLGNPERLPYGATEIEQFDFYRAKRPQAPAQIFVHGGAWRGGAAKDYAFLAEIFVGAGAHFIALDFASIPPSGGSLMPMANQVRHAIAWIWRNAPRLGIDRDQLYLSGFSSGGHLAAVGLTTDWNGFAAPCDVIKGGFCCSGIYDLKPVRLLARNRYVRLDDQAEQELSPNRHLDRLNAPLVIAYGSLETPEFRRQSRDFAEAVQAAGKPVELLVGTNYNHFELFETMANPHGLLGRAALAQMKLAPFWKA